MQILTRCSSIRSIFTIIGLSSEEAQDFHPTDGLGTRRIFISEKETGYAPEKPDQLGPLFAAAPH